MWSNSDFQGNARRLEEQRDRRDRRLAVALYVFAFIGATGVGLWLGHWLVRAIAAVSCY